MVHKIFNASNVLVVIAFIDMFIFIPGTIEENPCLTMFLVVVFALCAYLAMKEDGKIR